MDNTMQDQIERLRQNPGAAAELLRSRDGQELLRRLTENDRGAALQHATQAAARGNPAEMLRLVSQAMQGPEGAALVERIRQATEKK